VSCDGHIIFLFGIHFKDYFNGLLARLGQTSASDCPALAELCGNYGITPVDLESLGDDMPKRQAVYRELHEMVERMSQSRKARLFLEGVEILTDDSRLPERVPRAVFWAAVHWQDRKQPMDDVRMEDLRIKGDAATGQVGSTLREDPTKLGSRSPFDFVKVNGEWRIGPAESAEESE
jgi:hypothetical protein